MDSDGISSISTKLFENRILVALSGIGIFAILFQEEQSHMAALAVLKYDLGKI